MNKLLILPLAFIFLFTFLAQNVNAEADYYSKIGQPFNLTVICVDGISCSASTTCVASMQRPDFTLVINNQTMNRTNDFFFYQLNATQTNTIGVHYVLGICYNGTSTGNTQYTLELTPSGFGAINTGQGFVTILPIFVLLILSGVFMFLSSRTQAQVGKWIFFSLSGIFLSITFLLTITIMQENISGYPSINRGFTVPSTLVSIGTGLLFFLLPIIFGVVFALKGIKKSRVNRGLAMEGDSIFGRKNQ